MHKKVTTKVFVEADNERIHNAVETSNSVFSFKKIMPSPALKGRELENWRFRNWGTSSAEKNAHIVSDTEDEVIFTIQTYHGYPEPILKELSKKLGAKVSCLYTDEELGSNCGFLQYEKGKLIDEWYPEDDYTGIAFSAEVNGLREIDMGNTILRDTYSEYDIRKIEEASENIYVTVTENVGYYIGA